MFIILALLIFFTAFAVAGLFGAPYVPIRRRDSRALFKAAGLKAGQTLVDLGSGDGQLLRLAARHGLRAIGYEINPFMVLVSRLVCWRYRRLVTIHLANLWDVKLPPADAIYVFLMPRFMARLHHKLVAEITQPTTVISYVFEIPGRPPIHRGAGSFIYRYGTNSSPRKS